MPSANSATTPATTRSPASRTADCCSIASALERTQQTGRRGALLFCDLNHFKQVNDGYGHEAGDRAVREMAARLGAEARHCDTVARLGGDESAVSRPLPDITVQVTASIGTAPITPQTTDLDALLHTADKAMYTTKHRRP